MRTIVVVNNLVSLLSKQINVVIFVIVIVTNNSATVFVYGYDNDLLSVIIIHG